jgi:DNA-binding response OmpR family regulator
LTDGPRDCGPILIAEDDSGVRALVASALREVGYDPREADDGRKALEAARRERPAGVILDVNLPGLSGYEVCRRLRDELGADVPIVFISGERVEPLDRVAGLLVGADDYVTKPFLPEELLARLGGLLRRANGNRPTGGGLTRREHEVLALLAEGLSQAEIARRLVISPNTVSTHVEHVLAKLGVHSRSQAVALAYRQGLLEPPSPR